MVSPYLEEAQRRAKSGNLGDVLEAILVRKREAETELLEEALKDYKPYPPLYNEQGFVNPKPEAEDFDADAYYNRHNIAYMSPESIMLGRVLIGLFVILLTGTILWAAL